MITAHPLIQVHLIAPQLLLWIAPTHHRDSILGDNRAWYRSGAAAHPFNAVRKTDSHPLFARATMFIMQTGERVLATLRAHEVELRRAGLRSLSLLGSLARGGTKTGSEIDLAAGGHENEITGVVQVDFQ